MSAKIEEVKLEQQISTEVWQWYKKYYHASNTEADWKAIITDMRKIKDKYDNQLTVDLLLAYLGQLERHIKGEE